VTPAQLYDLFRSDVVDVAEPYLWSEDEVWGFMDDAYRRMVRIMGGISDATSDLTQLEVAVDDIFVDVDPRIIKIRHAQKTTNDAELQIVNFEDTMVTNGGDDYGIRRALRLTSATGPLQYLVAGMELNKLRCVPVPDTAETVSLIVYRYPLESITADSQPDEFEIEEQHHIHLLDGMKSRAYGKQDAETFDKGKSEEYEASFLRYCENVKHERELSEHKYRTVAYGGI
jgi:hypothetical protein